MDKDDVLEEFKMTALMGCKAVREFLTYQGENKAYLNRAKAGAVAMGSYARLRATLANEQQIALIQQRLASGEPPIGLLNGPREESADV
jgi:hypothetical protein